MTDKETTGRDMIFGAETKVISSKRHKELLRAETILNALYAGGVDNWEWYSDSLEGLDLDSDSDA